MNAEQFKREWFNDPSKEVIIWPELMEAYANHKNALQSKQPAEQVDLEKELKAFLVWQVKEGMFTGRMPQLFTDIKQYLKTKEG